MKLQTHDKVFYYPDVMVVCQPSDDDYYETSPWVVFEIMSETIAQTDKCEKLRSYLQLASLQA